jgi:hypothetical protein
VAMSSGGVRECPGCKQPFGWFGYKQRCRNCQEIYCADCVSYDMPIHKDHYGPGVKKVKKGVPHLLHS